MHFCNRWLALAGLAFSLSSLEASTISSCATGNGGGGLTVNSCGFGLNPNTFSLTESFNATAGGGAQFSFTAGAAQEYLVTKVITNNTALTWTGFDVLFGGGNFGFIIPTTIFQFDLATAPTISGNGTGGATLASTNNLLNWTNLNVAPGDTITLTFAAEINATTAGQWQILQQPIGTQTPEPATMLLSATALVALGVWKRRRL
jgi:hypothetical protein